MSIFPGDYPRSIAVPRRARAFSRRARRVPDDGFVARAATRFARPGDVAFFGGDVATAPYLHRVPPDLACFRHFFEAVGVRERFGPADYAGVRPKLRPPSDGAADFCLLADGATLHLLGVESPGLTASLALADEAADAALGLPRR